MSIKKIQVYVADDHAVVREGLERIFELSADLILAAHFEDVASLLDAIEAKPPDVVVLDLSLPGGGVEALRRIREDHPRIPVVIYSMYPEDQYGPRMLKAGASAYLSKGRSTTILLEAIRRAHVGRRYVTQAVAERLIEAPDTVAPGREALSGRELEILQLLVEGDRPSDIANKLNIGPSTVSTHIKRIKTKLGVNTLAEMIRYALRHDLIG